MPKISALPAAVSVGATDLFAIVQSATTKKAAASLVLAYTQSNIQITESQVTNLTTDLAAKLAKAANLSDLTDAAAARTNLGLGTLAVLSAPLGMTNGGTGANLTPTNGAIPYSTGTVMALLGPLTNGQLIVGSTGSIPVAASLTAGANITITPGAGTITIASTGNMNWTAVTGATQTIAVNNAYIANRGGGVAFALPATSAVGDTFTIVGQLGTWSITQAAGQQINVGATATTLGATGTLTSAAATDSANFVCITANTIWQVVGGPQTAGFVLA